MSPLATLLLLVWPLAAASEAAAESWETQLTPEQQQELQDRLRALQKENHVQSGFASEYGQRAVEEQQEEYQRRRARLLEEFKAKAAASVAQSSDGTPQGAGSPVFLLADPKADNASSEEGVSDEAAWRERLTPKQRQELDSRLSHLHKKAAREEELARKDSPRQFQEMHSEYLRKESHLIRDFRHMADHHRKEEHHEHEHHGPEFELAELRKKAAKEEALARKDGPKELQERQQEYARKEEHLLAKIAREKNALEEAAKKPEAEDHRGAGGGAALTMLVEGTAPAGQAGAGEAWRDRLTDEQRQELDQRLFELRKKAAREEKLASKDGGQDLADVRKEYARKESHVLDHFERKVVPRTEEASAESQGSKLEQELAKLRKKAAREEAYAREDGPEELKERQQEFARKEERLLAKLRKEQNASEAAPSAALLLVADPDASNSSKSAEGSVHGWEQEEPRPDQQQKQEHEMEEERQKLRHRMEKLEHKLARLRKKAAREEAYARKDGPKELRERQQEYARKEGKLLAKMGQQNSSEAASSMLLLAAVEDTSNASNASSSVEDWRQRLSEDQRQEMQHRLDHLRKENHIQMGYASEYGQAAVKYQEAEYGRKVAKVMAHYKAMAEDQSADEPIASRLTAAFAGRGPLGIVTLTAAVGLPAALVALAVGRRRAATAAGLQAPLMSEP